MENMQGCREHFTILILKVHVKNPKCSSILANVPQDPEIPHFPRPCCTEVAIIRQLYLIQTLNLYHRPGFRILLAVLPPVY